MVFRTDSIEGIGELQPIRNHGSMFAPLIIMAFIPLARHRFINMIVNSSILVTGAHRTGTTWVGKMLSANPHTAYISEPLNCLHRPGVLGACVEHWYTYISDKNDAAFLPAFTELFGSIIIFGMR